MCPSLSLLSRPHLSRGPVPNTSSGGTFNDESRPVSYCVHNHTAAPPCFEGKAPADLLWPFCRLSDLTSCSHSLRCLHVGNDSLFAVPPATQTCFYLRLVARAVPSTWNILSPDNLLAGCLTSLESLFKFTFSMSLSDNSNLASSLGPFCPVNPDHIFEDILIYCVYLLRLFPSPCSR